MKILITGGLGFIGSHLESELIEAGHEVFLFDRWRIKRDNYIRGDICDYFSLEKTFDYIKPHIVIHLAAMVSRKESEETPYMAIKTNIEGTLNVVLLCLKNNSRLIYAGSSEEYGTAFSGGKKVTENSPFGEPTSIYSMTKRMAEELIQYYSCFKGLVATTTRFFMLYGEGEKPSEYRSAIIRFIDAAKSGDDLNVHAGTARQWCYISDAIRAIRIIVERNQEKTYETFNIGNDEIISTEDLAKKILHITNSKSNINLIPVEETIIPIKLASFEKAYKELKWKAEIPLDEGLTYISQVGLRK